MTNLPTKIASSQPIELHDIVLPQAPGLWPLAPGWWLLIAMLLLGIFLGGRTLLKRYRYWTIKRLALKKLAHCQNCDDINQLLKQVAIHYCQHNIAPLKGQSWTDFLALSCSDSDKKHLADIQAHLYQPSHHDYFAKYQLLAQQWLRNLNHSTINEMNHAVI